MHSLNHHLPSIYFVPETFLDTENPAENKTVSSCPHARLVGCISRVISQCIQSGVTRLTLSPYSVPDTGNHMVDSMAEWLMLGLCGQTTFVCILPLLFMAVRP